MSTTVQTKRRLASLDLLRLLAVVLVFGRHMAEPPGDLDGGMEVFFAAWYRGGWVGVDVFFVLSGFLVSGLLFAEYKSRGRFSIGRFYMRRGWKIYPPYFALVGFTMLINVRSDVSVPASAVVSELLFLQSYIPGFWNHTWSLAVEEHFYILLPLVLFAVFRANSMSTTPLKPVLVLAVCVSAGTLAARLLTAYHQPFTELTHMLASHLRIDALFFGVAISYAYHFHTERFVALLSPWRRWLIAAGILMLTPAFVFASETAPFIYTAGLTVFYLASGMLMTGVLLSRPPKGRIMSHLAALGAYSYSIYLWHMPVRQWAGAIIEVTFDMTLGFGARVVIYVLGSFVVGVAMAKLIEVPALQLRDAWFPAKAAGPVDERRLQV